MAKNKTQFVCSQCGAVSPKWLGKCPDCGAWNSFAEEAVEVKKTKVMERSTGISSGSIPRKLSEIESSERQRYSTGSGELDRVLGGGLVKGSLTLISGDPGIGKSTLLLQTSGKIAESGKVLYISGEESEEQIKMRAERLGVKSDNLYLLSETSLPQAERHILDINPVFVIIDSIQTLYTDSITSAPGSVSQVRECSAELMRIGKTLNIPLFIVAHVTKSGELAGPRVLEHMVDTVLYFEGERTEDIRILRTMKNRFGTTSEIGVFEMKDKGLQEVEDASGLFMDDYSGEGTMVTGIMEGTRPILVQVQSLVQETKIVMPRRSAVGIGIPRLSMILAVLEKKLHIPFYASDVYVNVVGGITIEGTGGDLGLALSLISSARMKELPPATIALGEVGLTGEIRSVSRIERLVQEAEKMGFKNCIIPEKAQFNFKPKNLKLIRVKDIRDAYQQLFKNQ